MSLFSWDNTLEESLIDDEQLISIITLSDDHISSCKLQWFHSLNDFQQWTVAHIFKQNRVPQLYQYLDSRLLCPLKIHLILLHYGGFLLIQRSRWLPRYPNSKPTSALLFLFLLPPDLLLKHFFRLLVITFIDLLVFVLILFWIILIKYWTFVTSCKQNFLHCLVFSIRFTFVMVIGSVALGFWGNCLFIQCQ